MSEPIRYRVSFPEANLHYAQVEMSVPPLGKAAVELALPVWIPGSYMIREYARNVERVLVTPAGGGDPVEAKKSAKNRWRVRARGEGFTAAFRVYLCRRTVRESWVSPDRATLNPTNLLPFVVGHEARPHEFEIVPRPGWSRVDCPLDPLPGPGHRFRARDYEELADAVVQAGSHPARAFSVDGIPHLVTFVGEGNADLDRLAEDCAKIVTVCRDMFGGLPYPRYHFMLEGWAQSGSGGLEHPRCTLIMTPSWGYARAEEYAKRLSLIAHEYFHVWNVKAFHPEGLSPFDWETETLTDLLWLAEGFTSYYESLILLRAGLVDRAEFLKANAKRIADHLNAPGRRIQSAAESSYDTWIKYYRADENFANSQVSYYAKGALVALLLEAEIRRRTKGARSLDDLMRALHAQSREPGYRGYSFRDVKRLAESVAGGSLAAFFERYVFGTDEIDFPRLLAPLGIACRIKPPDAAEPWLGATTKRDPATGMPMIEKIHAEGPAAEAGLCVNDVVAALDGLRMSEETVKARLADRKPGDTVRLTLFRDDRLVECDVTLAARPTVTCALEAAGKAGPRAEIREAWLAGREIAKAKIRERTLARG